MNVPFEFCLAAESPSGRLALSCLMISQSNCEKAGRSSRHIITRNTNLSLLRMARKLGPYEKDWASYLLFINRMQGPYREILSASPRF